MLARGAVFILDVLRPYLEPLVAGGATRRSCSAHAASAFEPRNLERKARRALESENEQRVEAERPLVEWFGLHEARHSF